MLFATSKDVRNNSFKEGQIFQMNAHQDQSKINTESESEKSCEVGKLGITSLWTASDVDI